MLFLHIPEVTSGTAVHILVVNVIVMTSRYSLDKWECLIGHGSPGEEAVV